MAAENYDPASATATLSQRFNKMIADGSLDYNSWRSLILEIEMASSEDINTLSLAYDSFLSMFPLCHWHLEKYAYKKAKLCSSQEAVNIYERVVELAKFSVGFWVGYFTLAAACFGDSEDVRRLFGRAISFVGKDYLCHVLWDKYMKYEFDQEGWSFLAQSYIQVLRFPTKKLQFYYDNFKQFVANLEDEMGYDNKNSIEEQASVPCTATDLSKDEISLVIKDMLDYSDRCVKSKALNKYRSIGLEFYQEACRINEKIKQFERKIQRRYFDITPLDDDQLNNWHLYLDFIEKEDNLDSAIKLYERCLIPCANYPEFWMRYVDFLESKGGRELGISALARATQVFLKHVPEIHLFDARFREHIGHVNGACAALAACDTKTESSFIRNTTIQANLEKRLGNFAAASATYEKALKKARERQQLHLLPSLYSHFARLTFLMTGSASDARNVLIEGIREVPHCRFLLEELVKFAMTHEGASHVNIIDSVITDVISPGLDEYEGLNAKDRENISSLFLEFVDLCGTTHDIRKAWSRHFKLFPQSLRIRTSYKHSTPGNYSIDLARDLKGTNQPLRNPCYQGQEQVLLFPVNNEIHPDRVAGKLSPHKDHSKNAKDMGQVLSTKIIVSFNSDESQGTETAYENSSQSREDRQEPMVVSAELADQARQNALGMHDSDQDLLHISRGDELGPVDASAELGMQCKENSLSPRELGKSTETTELIEVSHTSLAPVQPELNRDLKEQKRPISLDNVSTNSQVKESHEINYVESPPVCTELERDGSVSHQYSTPNTVHTDPEESSRTFEASIVIDRTVPAPGLATSGFKEHAQQNSAGKKRSLSELGIVQEHKASDEHQPTSMGTPSNNMPAGQTLVSALPVSYPQGNTNQVTSSSGQQPLQAQQSSSMDQMFQYHYHQQQQLLQQQYQQQLHMQNAYFQHYMNQQPYQSSTYQQSQQMQGHETHPNFQQGQTQYHQSQDLASYQAYQTTYQQQLLWQQYQQYQGYQQQQSRDGSVNMLHEHHQQVDSKENLTQSMGQSQKGSKTAVPNYGGTSKTSESPHQVLQ